ncbi:MAG: MATE family multidrug resistance protein [Myxococcota bacterium]|jgi:MATE family multidrug resistance protein
MQHSASEDHRRVPVSTGAVARLAWPIMVSMLSYTLMSVIDTIFVGQLGTAELAGVGLAVTLIHLSQSFGWGLLGGLKVVISQRFGAGDTQAADQLAWQGLWVAGLLGTAMASLGPLGPMMFGWMGGSASIIAHADLFFRIRLLGVPLLFVVMALSAHFHGRGETRTPMVATLLSNGVNIALDPIFIFGWWGFPALGVGGAALATVLGIGTGALFLWLRLFSRLWASDSALSSAWLREIWRIGSPMGLRNLLEVGSFTFFAAMLVQSGEAHLAAHVLVIRIISVSFLPGHALGEASSVLVGQSIGAARPDQARLAWRSSVQLAVGVMAGMGLLFWLLPGALLDPFGATAEVQTVGRRLLAIAALFQIFDAVAMVGLLSLNGAGDTRFTMIISVGSAWLVKLPLGYALAIGADLGAAGAWWGLTAEIIVVAGAVLWRLQGEAWLERSPSPAF